MRPFSVPIWPETKTRLPLRTQGTYAQRGFETSISVMPSL